MTDIRIQDFGENSKADANNDYVMTFNDNSESKTRLRDAFYSIVPDGMQTHNNIFRGSNLGALTSDHITKIEDGSFHDMFIGDYFSINGSNYVIAGMDIKHFRSGQTPLGYHLLLMPDKFSKLADGTLMDNQSKKHITYMNDTRTTAGGFANTKLYKTYLPSIQKKLEADFGSYLLKFEEVVSTHVDDSGAPDQGEWVTTKVAIPNETMVYGTTLNGNNKNGAWYNVGEDNTQLPLFRLNPDEMDNHTDYAFWLRDIHSASEFLYAGNKGEVTSWVYADDIFTGIRAFFLVG